MLERACPVGLRERQPFGRASCFGLPVSFHNLTQMLKSVLIEHLRSSAYVLAVQKSGERLSPITSCQPSFRILKHLVGHNVGRLQWNAVVPGHRLKSREKMFEAKGRVTCSAAAREVRHWRLRPVGTLEARAPRNKVVVAIANKLARIAWAVLFRGKAYEHSQVCAQA
jgi:hypothetical protein